MNITITSGTGEGPTAIAAFDAALRVAGVENYNLILLSSIIPPGSTLKRTTFVTPIDEYGHRLYVVMARCDEHINGRAAWAGVGWTQEPEDGRGLFVELHGDSETSVQMAIDATLTSMMASRGRMYGPIHCEVVGSICRGKPVCALVIAVYQSQGWGSS
jgi:arginine decarboxylase